jgi:hypothetical protein
MFVDVGVDFDFEEKRIKVKIFKTVFLTTAKHGAHSGSCGTIACMNFHRRNVANVIYRWIVIAVYVETGMFLILTFLFFDSKDLKK